MRPLAPWCIRAAVILALLFTGGCKDNPVAQPCSTPQDPGCAIADLKNLTMAEEHRCSGYDRDDYPYSQSVEDQLIAEYGGVYSPYTGEYFGSKFDTDIEHMVAI